MALALLDASDEARLLAVTPRPAEPVPPAAPGVAPELRAKANGALVNAGAWTHTSLALRDALSGVALPYVEVHLSNIFAREPERRHSVLASGARGVVCGLGAVGYELALGGLVAQLRAAK